MKEKRNHAELTETAKQMKSICEKFKVLCYALKALPEFVNCVDKNKQGTLLRVEIAYFPLEKEQYFQMWIDNELDAITIPKEEKFEVVDDFTLKSTLSFSNLKLLHKQLIKCLKTELFDDQKYEVVEIFRGIEEFGADRNFHINDFSHLVIREKGN
jgi:hypothetical protein